jgi:tRNA A37 N6-isopentenylltransferase MiaA
MSTVYKCLYCGQVFSTGAFKAYIKHRHRDKVEAMLSKMREDRIRNLMEQGIDPEEWATELLAAMGFKNINPKSLIV